MRKFYAYIRVSTARQGERGVSLQEQRDAILRHAQRHGLEIAQWFEERETAAKRGRPVFGQMLRLLKQGKTQGLLIHKIDRSARNLKDWADLGELIDQGIEVHFANESLDLSSRGGRLSADIQAVVAADYIRNLREEAKKGINGRLKQGILPLPAPVGYLDKGKAKPKEPDPQKAPLVKKAFELYATGQYNLETLIEEMHLLGLRNRRGGRVSMSGMSVLLNNPFYIGLIRIKRTGETYPGAHLPLISKSLFDRVQAILNGRVNARLVRHDFLFRRLLRCKACGYTVTGELQKGHVYYRCHFRGCFRASVREDEIEEKVLRALLPLRLNAMERVYIKQRTASLQDEWERAETTERESLALRIGQIQDRLRRLMDAFIDGAIERELFEERKASLLLERKDLEERLARLQENSGAGAQRLSDFFELADRAYYHYKMGIPEEKRELLRITTSNRALEGKNVEITLSKPFFLVAERPKITCGAPHRKRLRTLDVLLRKLVDHFQREETPNAV